MEHITFSLAELEIYNFAIIEKYKVDNLFNEIQKEKSRISSLEKEFDESKENLKLFGCFEDSRESCFITFEIAKENLENSKETLKNKKKFLKIARKNLIICQEKISNENVSSYFFDETIINQNFENKKNKNISHYGGEFLLNVHSVVKHVKDNHMSQTTSDFEIKILKLFEIMKKESRNKSFVRFVRVQTPKNIEILRESLRFFDENPMFFVFKNQNIYMKNLKEKLESYV